MGGSLVSVYSRGEGMKKILRRGHPGALSSVPIPPSLAPLHRVMKAAGRTKPRLICSLSSLSPDSCRLLTSSALRQWRERGTGAD